MSKPLETLLARWSVDLEPVLTASIYDDECNDEKVEDEEEGCECSLPEILNSLSLNLD